MTAISFQEASIRSEIPLGRIHDLAGLGYFRVIQNPFDQMIDSDSFDQYLANQQPPVQEQQDMIIRRKEVKMFEVFSSRKGHIEFFDPEVGNDVRIEIGFEEITPEQAEKYLQKNIQNRNTSPQHINSYCEEMLGERWRIIPGGVAFDTNGNVINGQHTLLACKKSGASIISQVSRGIPREYCPAMDAGKKKTLSNHMQMLGRPERNEHFAVAKLLERGIIEHHNKEFTNDQQIKVIQKYWDVVNFSVSATKGVKFMHAPLVVMIARAAYTQDRGDLLRFIEVFKTGLSESKREWGAIRLKKYMTEEIPAEYVKSFRPEIYRRAESCLSAFFRGYPLKGQLYKIDHELYLMPGEDQRTADRKAGIPESPEAI